MPTRLKVPRLHAVVLANRIEGASLPKRRPRSGAGSALDRAIDAVAPRHALAAKSPGACQNPKPNGRRQHESR